MYYKKHETLTAAAPFHVYVSKINNRLLFIMKDGYRLELQMPETMKLFGSTRKNNRQHKKWRKIANS